MGPSGPRQIPNSILTLLDLSMGPDQFVRLGLARARFFNYQNLPPQKIMNSEYYCTWFVGCRFLAVNIKCNVQKCFQHSNLQQNLFEMIR